MASTMAGGHETSVILPAVLRISSAAGEFRNRRHPAMKSILLGATILMGLAAPGLADINDIPIDASSNGGKVTTLAITQDDSHLANQVSGNAGGATPFPVAGPWDTGSINQKGGSNKLYGSVKATSGSTAASLTASYTGGNNTHSLTIGNTAAPANPVV